MSILMESLRTGTELPPAVAQALHTHQPMPLPRGPYPTLKWPEGCTHLAGVKESLTTGAAKQAAQLNADVAELQRQAAAKNAAHVYTLRPHVQPKPGAVVEVTFEGAKHVVALDQDEDQGPDFWIDAVKIGGVWHSACDTFRDDFIRALEKQVREDFAYEAAAQIGGAE